MRPTFHIVAREAWTERDPAAPYVHPSLAEEGFIHCTDGEANLRATANRHYRDDPRELLVLTLDLDRVGSPWRIDDPGSPYPHVYGPIDPAAVIGVRPLERGPDGSY